MGITDILKDLEKGKECEVITSWKEVPIRVKLPIRWVSPQDRFISFDSRENKFKHVFSDRNPIYIKLRELFFLCRIFSNIRDELVLEVESPVPAPPIVMRESIRVEPTDKEPVYVTFCVEDKCIYKIKAVDISESGVGVVLRSEQANKLVKLLSEIATDAGKMHTPFDIEIELPKEGSVHTSGELKNIISMEKDLYIRLGFKLNLREDQKRKIRQYIMKRQREILEQLKSL
ncbi:MAG: PilZ domain-containing protein [Aquificaceae bacterium]|nr:PilZ domain-containing protein [Aquificaceae bacterium]